MDHSILKKAGLTDSQAKGYIALIERGRLSAPELASAIGESRTNSYAIAERLVELGLAIKDDSPKLSYLPDNPAKLNQLLVSKQREIKAASQEIAGILPTLISTYRLVSDKPGVLHLEGIDSLRLIYDDVIKTGQTLHVFPSAYDRQDTDTAAMIDKQIARQRKAGIKTRALLRHTIFEQFDDSQDDLFEARPANFSALEAQILLYGNNIAISTFGNGVVSTILTSPAVAQTFLLIFEALWNQPVSDGPQTVQPAL